MPCASTKGTGPRSEPTAMAIFPPSFPTLAEDVSGTSPSCSGNGASGLPASFPQVTSTCSAPEASPWSSSGLPSPSTSASDGPATHSLPSDTGKPLTGAPRESRNTLPDRVVTATSARPSPSTSAAARSPAASSSLPSFAGKPASALPSCEKAKTWPAAAAATDGSPEPVRSAATGEPWIGAPSFLGNCGRFPAMEADAASSAASLVKRASTQARTLAVPRGGRTKLTAGPGHDLDLRGGYGRSPPRGEWSTREGDQPEPARPEDRRPQHVAGGENTTRTKGCDEHTSEPDFTCPRGAVPSSPPGAACPPPSAASR